MAGNHVPVAAWVASTAWFGTTYRFFHAIEMKIHTTLHKAYNITLSLVNDTYHSIWSLCLLWSEPSPPFYVSCHFMSHGRNSRLASPHPTTHATVSMLPMVSGARTAAGRSRAAIRVDLRGRAHWWLQGTLGLNRRVPPLGMERNAEEMDRVPLQSAPNRAVE